MVVWELLLKHIKKTPKKKEHAENSSGSVLTDAKKKQKCEKTLSKKKSVKNDMLAPILLVIPGLPIYIQNPGESKSTSDVVRGAVHETAIACGVRSITVLGWVGVGVGVGGAGSDR